MRDLSRRAARRRRLSAAAWLVLMTAPAWAASSEPPRDGFPVTVKSCGRDMTIDAPPKRAVSYGSNLTEIMLALELQDQMVGFVSVRPAAQDYLRRRYPSMAKLEVKGQMAVPLEKLVDMEPDFFFAGWHYGLRISSEFTPSRLKQARISVYELSESCANLGQASPPSFDYLFRDMLNLGAIFGAAKRAEDLVQIYRDRLDRVAQAMTEKPRPTVFVDSGGNRTLLTAGALSMPQAIIDAAGGRNVITESASWLQVGWETVIEANPDVIILINPPGRSTEERIAFLTSNPLLQDVRAIRTRRFVAVDYDQLVPGPQNVDLVELLARELHNVALEPSGLQ